MLHDIACSDYILPFNLHRRRHWGKFWLCTHPHNNHWA